MGSRTRRRLRGAASLALFALFGIGALLITPLMLLLRRPERCQPIVIAVWRPMVWLFGALGLLRLSAPRVPHIRGSVLVANHPSLIDVMLLSVLLPRTLYVAKHALRRHPFLAAIVRATSLPDDENLPSVAASYLAAGWNVLVFPEGTRTPLDGPMNVFRRGAAQLALRTAAPVEILAVSFSRRFLAKGQPVWDVGDRRIDCTIARRPMVDCACRPGESRHAAAVRLTAAFRSRLEELLA